MIAAATQEVVTAVKLKLHMTVLVLNDNAYGVRALAPPCGAGLRASRRLHCVLARPPASPLAMVVCCLVGLYRAA